MDESLAELQKAISLAQSAIKQAKDRIDDLGKIYEQCRAKGYPISDLARQQIVKMEGWQDHSYHCCGIGRYGFRID